MRIPAHHHPSHAPGRRQLTAASRRHAAEPHEPPLDRGTLHALSGLDLRDAAAVVAHGDAAGNGAVALWKLPTGHARPAPAVSERGDLFEAGWGSTLRAVSAAGVPRWDHEAPGAPAGLSVTPGGTAFVAGDRAVEAYDADGQRVWSTKPSRTLHAGSAAGPEGNCYVADNLRLYALDPRDGHVAWSYSGEPASRDVPAVVGDDGTVYYATANDSLVALDAAGHVRWSNDDLGKIRTPLFEDIATRIGVDGHGNACFVARDGTLRALDAASGRERWRVPLSAPGHREAAPDADGAGTVYAVGGGELIAVDEGGAVRWRRDLGEASPTQLVGAPTGGVVLAFEDGRLQAWDADGDPAWSYALPSVDSRPVFGPHGEVYVGSDETLYALAPLDHYGEELRERAAPRVERQPDAVVIDGVRIPRKRRPGHAAGFAWLQHSRHERG